MEIVTAGRGRNNSYEDASFLGLPPELRVRIYEEYIACEKDLPVGRWSIRPVPHSKPAHMGTVHNIWALSQVCSLVL